MNTRKHAADFDDSLESGTTANCGTEPSTSEKSVLARTNRPDAFQKFFRKAMGMGESTDDNSTILAGQAASGEDSPASTDNSFKTARSDSPTDPRPPINLLLDRQMSEVPGGTNRTKNIPFSAESELDLSPSSRRKSSEESNAYAASSSSPICQLLDSPWPEGTSTSRANPNTKIFKRLSEEFILSPRVFTERLVTIIDQSENIKQFDASLSNITRDFRKMCKYIQDESMPAHLNSTLGISKLPAENETSPMVRIPETIAENPVESPPVDRPGTPEKLAILSKENMKTPLNMFKKSVRLNSPNQSPGSPNSTRHFEILEEIVNNEPDAVSAPGKTPSVASATISNHLWEKEIILRKSAEQWASLDETFNSHRAYQLQGICDTEENIGNPLPEEQADRREETLEDVLNREIMDEDELSTSLRFELKKQRERCFETARAIQKIEEDAKKTNDDYLERYGINPELELRKTLGRLMEYEKCHSKLQKHNAQVSSKKQSEKKVRAPEIAKEPIKTPKKTPRAEYLHAEMPKSGKKAKSPEARYFVTPGNPAKPYRKKPRLYFPTMEQDMRDAVAAMAMSHRSRLNFDPASVMSPVRRYIHGPSSPHVQNVKTTHYDDRLLTPTKPGEKEEKILSRTITKIPKKQLLERKKLFCDAEDGDTEAKENLENEDRKSLPSLTYRVKDPSRVKIVDKTTKASTKMPSARGLLEPVEKCLVISHKSPSIREVLRNLEGSNVPERISIDSNSAEMSVHVHTLAKKTNFL